MYFANDLQLNQHIILLRDEICNLCRRLKSNECTYIEFYFTKYNTSGEGLLRKVIIKQKKKQQRYQVKDNKKYSSEPA